MGLKRVGLKRVGLKHARVSARRRAPDRPAIQVAPGDAVTLGQRDSDWPQFIWTTLTGGLGGLLFDRERGDATAQHEYDPRELDSDIGDRLVLHREMADWWWADNTQGASGRIPALALQIIDDRRTDEN